MLEGRFDLLQGRFLVGLSGALEEGALVGGHLPDRFQFIEPEEPGQPEGIARIFFVGMRADELVVPRVAHEQLRHVRTQQLPEPAGQIGLFEGQALVRRGDGLHVRDEFIGLGGDAPEAALPAVIVELGQHAILRVSIQLQPCYG